MITSLGLLWPPELDLNSLTITFSFRVGLLYVSFAPLGGVFNNNNIRITQTCIEGQLGYKNA